jgi:Zn-dependent protease with chaperone function
VLTTREEVENAPTRSPVIPVDDLISYRPGWRQAERAKQWNPLSKKDITPLLLAQIGTAIALFWVLQQFIYLTDLTFSSILFKIPFLNIHRPVPIPLVWQILLPLVILFVASRWVLDGLLTVGYGLQSLTLTHLSSYSTETVKAINRYCRQRKIPLPALGILPTAAPIAFSYGVLPRFTRIVVSRGLLEQLEDDEIATVYASEIGHIAYGDVPLMSLLTVVNQIPYTIYWVVAEWGNRQRIAILRGLAIVVSALSYGIYSLTRWIGLWLSRQRVFYSDHAAADLTGNPNGFTRSLLKIAIGTARDVEEEGKTSYLLEGFELLSPLGHQMATSLGSMYHRAPLEPLLKWDLVNPYRHWLALTNSHPPTGERLHLLSRYAHYWRLPSELDFSEELEARPTRSQKSRFSAAQWRTILLQGAPFFGMSFGLLLALALSLVGLVGRQLNISFISWMYGDRTILRGLLLIGFSLGTFIRINPFFPDIKLPNTGKNDVSPSVIELLQNPDALPLESTPVRLEGKLLGRPGISNILSQDLLLKTEGGMVRLHCLSPLGPIGNLLPKKTRFTDLINQNLLAIGWFRRGVTPWIDVDNLRTSGGRVDRSNHPVWSTLLGAIATIWGIYIILVGGVFY